MFYFVSYVVERNGNSIFRNQALDEHPINWIERENSGNEQENYILLNFQEITEEQYITLSNNIYT